MSLLIKNIIDDGLLKDVSIVAGYSGQYNEITWINVMEILDSPESVQRGELLVTTGYQLNEEGLYSDLIATLKNRGVSGIAIQRGYYIDSIPQYIIDEANKYNFPVLDFPKTLTFSEILHVLIQKINVSKKHNPLSDASTKMLFNYFHKTLSENSINFFIGGKLQGSVQLFLLQPINYYSVNDEVLDTCAQKIKSFITSQAVQFISRILNSGTSAFLISFSDEVSYQAFVYEFSINLTYLSEQHGVNYYVGVERLQTLDYLSLAFAHSMEGIHLLKSIHARRGICSYENMTFIKMLGILHKNDSSIVLDNQALQILLNYDRINQTNYVHTLRTYLAENCNTTRASKRLFIHRHTLIKRLEKITDLSGINLENYYARIYMSVALLFHDFFAF